MNIASFFSGAGGMDLGFQNAGFNILWANEFDKNIWLTHKKNFSNTILEKRSITEIDSIDVPDVDGIIGGPPCQSWSIAGAKKGIKDKRGQLFYDFIRILDEKQPKFFVAENVAGMLSKRNENALKNIIQLFNDIGYELSVTLVDAWDYNVPQNRKRVFFVGYRKDLKKKFLFPKKMKDKPVLKDALKNLPDLNNEYATGGFSSMYMSRNRVRSWEEPSFTIQASGRHAPLHPQAPKMELVSKDVRKFVEGKENLYRRLSVREAARIQTFPDNFEFLYENIENGYKMVGNAVPVNLAYAIAKKIREDLYD